MAKKTHFRLPYEAEYRVAGVFCPEKDYRLCWLINNYLKVNFSRRSDISLPNGKDAGLIEQYAVYHHEKEELQQAFFLVSNRSHNGHLLFHSPPQLDFLMLIDADDSRFDFNALLKKIRSIPHVTAAYMLDDVLGRNRDIFLYDFEMFIAGELKS